jgi:hypothetical protein
MDLLDSKSKPIQGMMECIDPLVYQKVRKKLLSRNPQLTTSTQLPNR